MRQLSPEGQQVINNLAQQYNFSVDAVMHLLQSVINGNGSMAQFNHPELGGSGQWMQGGMLMLGDMFNYGLKNNVDGLCYALSDLVTQQPGLLQTGSFQSQSQGDSSQASYYNNSQQQNDSGPVGPVSLFVPPPAGSSGNWWPADLQFPTSTGAQNQMRYAYFANIQRLVIDVNGHITVYDTLDHQIGGFSQQQSSGSSITFSSQYGLVDVNNLPIISVDGVPVQSTAAVQADTTFQAPADTTEQYDYQSADIFTKLEKLADLKAQGILSDDEFQTKKAELLSRL